MNTITDICAIFCITFYNWYNVYIKLLCKFIISHIVCRHCHNCTCSIVHHYIIWYIYWYFFFVYWIYCCYSFYFNSCFVFYKLSSFKFSFFTCFFLIFFNCIYVWNSIFIFSYYRMFRCDNHKCYSK